MKLLPFLAILLLISFTFAAAPIIIKNTTQDGFKVKDTTLTIAKSSDYSTNIILQTDKIKMEHWLDKMPKDLTYSINYSGKVLIGSEWVDTKEKSEVNSTVNSWIMFDDGYVFDFSDFNDKPITLDYISTDNGVLTIAFKFNKEIKKFPYYLDPTYGNGTIQNCLGNATNYCNVTISSTIFATDFYINNTETIIQTGVTVALDHSRLFINSTDRFWLQTGATISGNGGTQSGAVAGSGGSGGSILCRYSGGNFGVNGATNGASGNHNQDGTTPCNDVSEYTPGTGSGVTPFDHSAASAGAYSTGYAKTGGFYATGGVWTDDGADQVDRPTSGGSGQAIKISAAHIQIDGSITSNAGAGKADVDNYEGAAGGSGAGELTLYSITTNITGSITMVGSNGLIGGGCGSCKADGGGGGKFRSCVVLANYTTGSITLSGGSAVGGGSAGSAGTIVYNNSAGCFIDATPPLVNITYPINTTYTTNVTSINFTATDSALSTCWYSVNGGATNVTASGCNNIIGLVTQDGSHTWIVWANDTSGNIGNSMVSFFQDATKPIVTLNNPANSSAFIVSSVTFNWTSTDALSSYMLCNLTIDNVVEATDIVSYNNTPNSTTIYGIGYGLHNWNVTCADQVGNTNTSETRTFLVNVIEITPVSPLNGSTITTSVLDFNASVDGSGLRCNTSIDNGYQNTSQLVSGNFINYTKLVSPGNHNISIFCYDVTNIGANKSYMLYFSASYTPLTILTPTNGDIFYIPTNIPFSASGSANIFDYCNVSINSALQFNFTNATYVTNITNSTIGTNLIQLSCKYNTSNIILAGIYSTSSSYQYQSPSVVYPFKYAFDFDVSVCPAQTQIYLMSCAEWYKIPSVFNFSAVVCQNLDVVGNYSCLSSFTNVTKNNFTIFYTPSYWNLPGGIRNGTTVANISLGHTGALFIYNGDDVTKGWGMELIDNQTFIYTRAQNKLVDCGIYLDTTCSYWRGFVVNDRIIAVSNKYNNWYTVAGLGSKNISEVWPQPVITVNVVPLPSAPVSIFENGIYTESSCIETNPSNMSNNTYSVTLTNTIIQTYTVFIFSNNSGVITPTSYSIVGNNLDINIPMLNVVNISITDSNRYVCKYGGENNMFLPFSFSFPINTDGFSGAFLKMIMLFTVILAGIVPYALIATFLINDIYHVMYVNDMVIIVSIALIAGISNNIFSAQRGIKNMIIVFVLGLSYLMLLQNYGVDELPTYTSMLSSYVDITSLMSLTDPWSFLTGAPFFIIKLFLLIVALPLVVVGILLDVLVLLLPGVLYTQLKPIILALGVGATIYFDIKMYEVLSNRFRDV